MISIHALCEEGDNLDLFLSLLRTVFLSTPSARRATIGTAFHYWDVGGFLSTPSARRATQSSML